MKLVANGFAVLIGQKLMSRSAAYVIMLPLSIPFGLIGEEPRTEGSGQRCHPVVTNSQPRVLSFFLSRSGPRFRPCPCEVRFPGQCQPQIWYFSFLASGGVIRCSLGAGLGEKPGWWSPEPMAAVKSAVPGEQQRAQHPQTQRLRRRSACARGCAVMKDFLSALKHPPFRWLFITSVCNGTYSTIQGLYFIYWFQDEVGIHGYSFFGHHVTDSAITAMAFLSTIDIVIGVVCTLPGGLIADHFADKRPLVLMVGAVLTVFQPLVNAYFPRFTIVCVTNIIGDVVSGLASPACGALICDCIPTDAETGLPINPSRDYLFMGYAGRIPEILIPAVLAVAFQAFESRAEAYKTFFILAAAIHLCSSLLFLKVGSELRKAKAARSHGHGQDEVFSAATNLVPSGARLCDALIFSRGEGQGARGRRAAYTKFSTSSSSGGSPVGVRQSRVING